MTDGYVGWICFDFVCHYGWCHCHTIAIIIVSIVHFFIFNSYFFLHYINILQGKRRRRVIQFNDSGGIERRCSGTFFNPFLCR